MLDTAIRAFAESARRAVRQLRQRWSATEAHHRHSWRLAAGSGAVGLVIALTAVAAAGPWDSGQRTAEQAWAAAQQRGSGTNHIPGDGDGDGPQPDPAPSAPDVLTALGSAPDTGSKSGRSTDNAPPPTASALADALEPLLKDPALGPVRTGSVRDGTTGRKLFSADPERPTTPASTIKLATAAAALSAAGADHRIETRVVRPKEHRIVLVGGGDPTLTAGELDDLAGRTARALEKDGTGKVSLAYDTSLYSGPVQHSIGPNNNLAPVTPLMVNEARLDDSGHGPAPRAADPAAEAARRFAANLDEHGVRVTNTPEKAAAPKKSEELAVHRSAPLGALVERMLTHSDNDLAEALARQTAVADGEPASFEGAGRAVRERLAGLGLPVDGSRFADGSGLSRDDKVSAALLTRILALASDPEHPELRPVTTGLPVAAFTGTLGGRYDEGQGGPGSPGPEFAAGAGLVRAKTGTLTGVNTLAGTVVDADGRLLVFAFMTTGTKDRYGAQAALDRLASTLANCGCR